MTKRSDSIRTKLNLPIGIAVAFLSAALFGLSTPFAKLLVDTVPPLTLAGLLYLGSGVGLGFWWLFKRFVRGERSVALTGREPINLAGAIVFGGILAPVCLMFGLSSTPASSAALLLNLEGVLTAVIAWLLFKENYDRRVVLGMIAITCGGVLLSIGGESGYSLSWGCVLVILACLAWALDNNLTRNVAHADALQIAFIKGLTAGAVNLGLACLLKLSLPQPDSIAEAMLVGFLGYGLSLVLFVIALRHLGTARTGAYFACAPFVGALASIALLKDPLGWNFYLAALLMAIGVSLHLSERHEHMHEHGELVHEHEHVHDEHHRHEHGPDDPPGEPHTHVHKHERVVHSHVHFPDSHHRHDHGLKECGRSLNPCRLHLKDPGINAGVSLGQDDN